MQQTWTSYHMMVLITPGSGRRAALALEARLGLGGIVHAANMD